MCVLGYPVVVNAAELGRAIDRDAEVPVGVQLAWALRARIEDGGVRPGERLPGLREVAEATGLNVNTVRAVYQRLDQEGAIESRQGSGTFVADTARAPASAHAIAANAAREARETGVDPRAVAAALYVAAADAGPDSGGMRRRELREQIAVLERAIGELESERPGVAPPEPSARPSLEAPALLSAAELEAVRSTLVRRLARLQAAIDAEVIDAVEPSPATKRAPARRAPAKGARTPSKNPRKSASRGPVRPAVAEG